MIHPFFAIHTVTIKKPTTRRELGKTVRDWTNPETTTVKGCFIKSGPTEELLTREEAALTEFTISLPPGTRVSRRDRVDFTYGGDTYTDLEVITPPRRPSGPTGFLDRVAIGVATRQEA